MSRRDGPTCPAATPALSGGAVTVRIVILLAPSPLPKLRHS